MGCSRLQHREQKQESEIPEEHAEECFSSSSRHLVEGIKPTAGAMRHRASREFDSHRVTHAGASIGHGELRIFPYWRPLVPRGEDLGKGLANAIPGRRGAFDLGDMSNDVEGETV